MTKRSDIHEGHDITSEQSNHIPVLLPQILISLSPFENQVIVDGTFGRGGYSRAFLKKGAVCVLGIDRDPSAQQAAQLLKEEFGERFIFQAGVFGELDQIARNSLSTAPDMVVLDIGVSSPQLDEANRGFSFQKEGPLDMRMSQEGPTAADIINGESEQTLADIFYLYGEERKSFRLAKAIVEDRKETPFETTLQLAKLAESVLGVSKKTKKNPKPKHAATRMFQALRLYVNDELGELVRGLYAAEKLLEEGGILAVVTFHSLEDRIVKRFFASRSGQLANVSRHLPQIENDIEPSFKMKVRKALAPTDEEIELNPRSRSSKLRFGIRTSSPAMPADENDFGLPRIER